MIRPKRPNDRPRQELPRIRWSGFRPMNDFWGQEIKRFYQLETLASATEWMVRTRDRFLVQSLQDAMGPAPIMALHFELFQEGKYQLIFRLDASNAKRKRGQFAYVVAKHHEEYSKVARAEHTNLRVLNQRAPGSIVKPFRGGTVFLPDRHHRASHGREVYAYLTQWLGGYHELGVNRNLQFFMNVPKPHTFTIDQTELIKGQMVEIVLRTYDPAKKDCMDMPQIASGDFVVTPAGRSQPKVKLIACRRMLTHATPVKIMQRIFQASWEWDGKELRLPPSDPAVLRQAFVRALGKEQAAAWFGDYAKAVRSGRIAENEAFPVSLMEV